MREIKVNVLLDTGSNVTLITEDVAQKLQLEGQECELNLDGIAANTTSYLSAEVAFEVTDLDRSFNKNIVGAQVVPIISDKVHAHDWSKNVSDSDLKIYPPIGKGLIDVLIGLDNSDLLIHRDNREYGDGKIIAIKTLLGWSCIGIIKNDSEETDSCVYYNAYRESLQSMIKKGKKKDQTSLGPVRNSRIEDMLFLSDKTFPVKNVLEPTLANDVIDLDQEKAPADLEGVDLTKGKCFLSIDEKKGIAVYHRAVDFLKKY